MLSPSLSLTTPGGETLNRISSRRRGLSYLRVLSQNRSSARSGTDSSRPSSRPFFQRSGSFNEPQLRGATAHSRRRSHSRPNEPTSPLAVESRGSRASPTPDESVSAREPTPSAEGPVAGSAPSPTDLSADSREAKPGEAMARQRTASGRRNTASAALHVDGLGAATNTDDHSESGTKVTRMGSSRGASGAKSEGHDGEAKQQLPTIRFYPHQENRNGRPSLHFQPVSRTLPGEHSIIRVGRYSEREGVPTANPSAPSDAPVGFKSKVVSRKHCEFSFVDGQWQIKDVASSSGTFLNHIRLSQPNTESRLFPIKDGDIVQLGIDFRGGEEMIFRCVKIRIECNRAWQMKPNTFNKSRHQQLQSLAKDQPAAGSNSGECSICLGSVLPCQALFVAPCAHVWHYKCIRPLLEGKNSSYPQFQCPNCRAYSDLTADVDVAPSDMDEWMESYDSSKATGSADAALDADEDVDGVGDSVSESAAHADTNGANGMERTASGDDTQQNRDDADDTPALMTTDVSADEGLPPATVRSSGLLARRQATNPISPEVQSMNGIDMPCRPDEDDNDTVSHLEQSRTRTETPDPDQVIAGEGPLTPRNAAGPFVLDGGGSAGRNEERPVGVSAIPDLTDRRI